jgi:transposase-like protein
MSNGKRYTATHKNRVLMRLAANGGDVALTSMQMGVPIRTLYQWKRDANPALQLQAVPQSPSTPAQNQAELAPGAAQFDLETLTDLRDQLIGYIQRLSKRLDAQIESAPFNQALSGMTELMDQVMKLGRVLPPPEVEYYLPGQELVDALVAMNNDDDDDDDDW